MSFQLVTICIWIALILGSEVHGRPLAMGSDQGAVVDLETWTGDHAIALDGPWEFYWQKFISPAKSLPLADAYLAGGKTWNELELRDGQRAAGLGYASLRLVLKGLKPHPRGYQIYIPAMNSAARAFVTPLHERRILAEARAGKIAKSASKEKYSRRYLLLYLPPGEHLDLQLIIHVSNFNDARGGWRGQVILGTGESAMGQIRSATLQDTVALGVTISIGIYLFLMWYRNRKDIASFALALLCLGTLTRSISTHAFFLQVIPEHTLLFFKRLEYASIVFGGAFGVQFIAMTFQVKGIARQICNAYSAFALFLTLLPFLSRPNLFTGLKELFQLTSLAAFVLYYPILLHSIWHKKQGAWLCFAGVTIILSGLTHDILYANEVIDTGVYIFPAGFSLFLILFAQVVAQRAALAHRSAEVFAQEITVLNQNLLEEVARSHELNMNLEQIVQTRTAEVRSLLLHIPQGILTIGPDGKIGASYSAHLPVLLRRQDLAHRSFKEIILDRAQMSEGEKDQIWQTILAILGEPEIAFEMNREHLPREFTMQGETNQVLRSTWNVEFDEDCLVKNILVTLLDVSDEKETFKKLAEKTRESRMIHQLIEIGPQKARQFFESAQDLFHDIEKTLQSSYLESEQIKSALVTMHTLKGAARTLQLLELADVIHLVENEYTQIMQQIQAIDRQKLLDDLEQTKQIFSAYRTLHQEVLGREDFESTRLIRPEDLESQLQLLHHIRVEHPLPPELQDRIDEACHRLFKQVFKSLPVVLDELLRLSVQIAQELGKESPHLLIEMDEILITQRQENALRHTLLHLLRNAMDHGIERPEERERKGKAKRGLIRVRARIGLGRIIILFEDDGAGLDIGRLRRDWAARDTSALEASVETVAETIFHPGVTTAQAVSLISGRGVGMDAARRLLESLGGRIELRLDERFVGHEERYRFHFYLSLPAQGTFFARLQERSALSA